MGERLPPLLWRGWGRLLKTKNLCLSQTKITESLSVRLP
nr:MAG TPA: hypothetical protein [Caudoviricetes sp.]